MQAVDRTIEGTSGHLIGLAVSDSALLRAFAEAQPRVVDVTASIAPGAAEVGRTGTWGLGFHAHGEMLVRKGPLRGILPGAIVKHLRDVRARHVVLCAEARGESRKLEDTSPLRYRDWLFAATGADSLGPGFAARVQASLPTYAFSHKLHPTAEEAVMMVAMGALERANARDTRDLTTRATQRAIGAACAELRRLADEGAQVKLLVTLHVPGHLFVFALGRPIWLARFRGAGEAARHGRLPRHEHLRAMVIGDRTAEPQAVVDPTHRERPPEVVAWERLPEGLAAEIDASCNLVQFPV